MWIELPWPENPANTYAQHMETLDSCFHLFSADHIIQDPAVLHISQQQFKAELDELTSVKEITKAIKQLRSSKVNGISLEKGLISSVYCDLHYWRLNQWPQIAEPKLYNWAISLYHTQVMPN